MIKSKKKEDYLDTCFTLLFHIEYYIALILFKYLKIDFLVVPDIRFQLDISTIWGYVCMPGAAQIIHEC